MKLIEQASVDKAFASGAIRSFTIVRGVDHRWYLAIEIEEPTTGNLAMYSLRTKRSTDLRTWADPRKMVDWIVKRYGARSGMFRVKDEANDD